MYTIEIEYTTGNSFGSERCTETVELTWDDLDTAKVALQEIKQHWILYKKLNDYGLKQDKRELIQIEFAKHEWNDSEYSMNIIHNNGTRHYINIFWVGYFEELHKATIIEVDDGELCIEFDYMDWKK